ncbi:hypothetical protein I3843_06G116500 [Carya illinoinensis]|uniref:Beta-galactosidase n=1 Tax=Carya illinoinensis TaxID=32201 RepID=A0A922EXA6_CARIL|nr:hypothetical protein I3760_06G124300 [Carya illinoinensis]KAG6709247.1 hypothetical protein I3842_06G122500 [Carya illinoinensis]KAG7975774.1 hypothetical protein I3843_06G116500 [Carya illinoinensis]
MVVPSRVLMLAVLSLLVSVAVGDGRYRLQNVTYDGRSLIINGKRELLFSGSIHYTRSTPEMWPDLIAKAKHGGLDFNFNGNYDVVKFIKMIGQQGMYVTLRIGPFIQAEWNHRGIPYWLREVPDIIFRSNNGPFKKYMKKYAKMIIDKIKEEKLFASQGGPIILSQIENEYNHIQLAYRDMGSRYVQRAAKMAVELNTEVPWIMCKQKDAPDPVINTCNGRHCGDTFTGPNKPHKPSLWTENWTAQYRVFGDPPSQRAAEDIAFSVACFFSKNGTLVNYYMYHGGTNFGRTSAVFTTTCYYDEAPIDEYGLQREPKWSHLRDLHKALNLCKKALLWGEHGVQVLGKHTEAQLYENPGTKVFNFRGEKYYLPPRSISILPDCKTVVFNTQTIVSQHNARNLKNSKLANNLKWEMSSEPIPTVEQLPVDSKTPKELYSLLKDTTDHAWYTTSIELGPCDLPMRPDIHPVLRIASLGHALHAFVNGEYVGLAHGSHDEKSFVFQNAVNLKAGVNHIALIGMTVGLPDSGAYMEHRYAGPRAITVLGLNTGTLDLTVNGWGHQVGLSGEKMKVFTRSGSHRVESKKADGQGRALTWYKTYFDAPEGNDPVAIRMTGMGKYHIPRSFIKPTENLLIVLEEEKGNPEDIEILLVNRNTICIVINEYHPPHVKSWQRKESKIRPVVDTVKPAAQLKCPNHQEIVDVEFASYGDPYGSCGSFFMGNCNAPITKEVVEQNCLGKTSCSVPIDRELSIKDNDACPDIMKTLAIQVKCDHKKH